MACGGSLIHRLEDDVKCPVCLEIYEDPQVLFRCQHSLCKACCDQWIKFESRIQCPKCRIFSLKSEIKSNLTLKSLVATYKEEKQKLPSHDNEQTETIDDPCLDFGQCDFCELETPQYFCHGCKEVLCKVCRRTHVKVSACAEKDFEDLQVLGRQRAEGLRQLIELLDETENELGHKLTVGIEEAKRTMHSVLERFSEAKNPIIASVEKHFQEESQKLESGFQEWAAQATELFVEFSATLKPCQKNLNEINTRGHKWLVKEYQNLEKQVNNYVLEASKLKMQDFLVEGIDESIPAETKFYCDCIKVVVQGVGEGNSVSRVPSRANFSLLEFFNGTLYCMKVPLQDCTYKLLVVQNHIWCFMKNTVEIRDKKTLELIKSLPTELDYIWGAVVLSDRSVLVAGLEMGLWLMSVETGSSKLLEAGLYHSVCISEADEIIALKEENGIFHIEILVMEADKIVSTTSINVNILGRAFTFRMLQSFDYPFTICAVNNYIYVCSWEHDVVYEISRKKGHKYRSFGKYDLGIDELDGLMLCDRDSKGVILISDNKNHRLQVLDPFAGTWLPNNPAVKVKFPTAAVITDDGKIICAGETPKKLYSYVSV